MDGLMISNFKKMASLSLASYPSIIKSSISKFSYNLHHQNNNISFPCFKVNFSTKKKKNNAEVGSSCVSKVTSYISNKAISTKFSQKMSKTSLAGETIGEINLVDPSQQRFIIKGEVWSRHTFVIRSYEVGASGTASIETILNLLQETGLNHTKMTGLCGGGFGLTNGMIRHNLIWVISRMQIHIDRYPIWDEIIDIDVWYGASGRHGIRCDWILRNRSTGNIYARATSKWAMMNCQSRRLSKMPDEVKEELSPWLSKNQAIQPPDLQEKIEKLDKNAKLVHTGLKPRWGDMDMNQHINNVKYVRWMLESIPDEIMKSHYLSDITIEYKKECGFLDVIQSLSEPRADEFIENALQLSSECDHLNGYSFSSGITKGKRGQQQFSSHSYIHLLQTEGEGQSKNDEVVRGKTRWKREQHSSTDE